MSYSHNYIYYVFISLSMSINMVSLSSDFAMSLMNSLFVPVEISI